MLSDKQFEEAHDKMLPVISPKGKEVWIDDTYEVWFDENDEPVNLTSFTDSDDIKRVLDTSTFKESFTPGQML